MRLPHCFALCVLLASCAGSTGTPKPHPENVPPYAPLLARAKAHDTTLNFTELRLAYTGSPDYQPYGVRDSDFRKAMYAAADSEAFAPAMSWVDSILASNFVDIEAHGLASFATAQLGDTARSDFPFWVTSGLLGSIDESGDGSESRPYIVISVAEEYAWASYRGFVRKGTQSLGDCNQRMCDAIGFTNRRTKQDTTLFFDVSIPYRSISRTLNR